MSAEAANSFGIRTYPPSAGALKSFRICTYVKHPGVSPLPSPFPSHLFPIPSPLCVLPFTFCLLHFPICLSASTSASLLHPLEEANRRADEFKFVAELVFQKALVSEVQRLAERTAILRYEY